MGGHKSNLGQNTAIKLTLYVPEVEDFQILKLTGTSAIDLQLLILFISRALTHTASASALKTLLKN